MSINGYLAWLILNKQTRVYDIVYFHEIQLKFKFVQTLEGINDPYNGIQYPI